MESDMQINFNTSALVAGNAINLATQNAAKASERISTTLKVNSAADDPGSMIMLNSTKAKIASWSKANDNITRANTMLQTMSASLTSIAGYLTSMRALAVTSAAASSDANAALNQSAFASYMAQIDSVSTLSTFNGISMLSNSSTSSVSDVVIAGTDGTFTNTSDANLNAGQQLTVSGTFGGSGAISGYADSTTYLVSAISGGAGTATGFTLVNTDGTAITTTAGTPTGVIYSTKTPLAGSTVKIQTGIDAGSTTSVNLYNTTTAYLGDTSAATNFRLSIKNLNTVANASSAITAIDTAISQISTYQSAVGATQNIMSGETSLNSTMSTASSSAYAKLTNADMAKETSKLAAAQIQQSSASAMLAQANQMNKDMVTTLLKQFIN
jgi:flagellin